MFLDIEFLKALGVGDYSYTENLISESYVHYEQWLSSHYEGVLQFLADERKDLRKDLRFFFEKTESALVFLFPYPKKKNQKRVASFLSGFKDQDYHFVLEERLEKIAQELKLKDYKICVDRFPILEKDLAFRAGLGFFGKNSLLIHPRLGSFHLIGTILLSQKLDLPQREKSEEKCGECRRCLEACPTKAIVNPKVIDARRCLSAFTLENFKEASSPEGHDPQGYILGCDRCQDVCPFNEGKIKEEMSLTTLERFFQRSNEDIQFDIEKMSQKVFKNFVRPTALSRMNKKALLKNLK